MVTRRRFIQTVVAAIGLPALKGIDTRAPDDIDLTRDPIFEGERVRFPLVNGEYMIFKWDGHWKRDFTVMA